MATKYWQGDAVAVAQVDTLTVGGTVEVGDVFNTTINGKTVAVSATTTSTTTTATEIKTALDASTIQEFQEITWTSNAAVVTGTAKTAGKPFEVTVTTTEAGGGAADAQTYVRAASVANAGPNDVSSVGNYSDSALPGAADTLYIDHGSDLLYGLNALSAVTLTLLHIAPTFTGKIGLPNSNVDGGTGNDSYEEYRPTYLAVSATTLNNFSASGRIKINTGANATAVNVQATGQGTENGVPAFLWKGTHASNTVTVSKGSVGIAFFPTETATVATLKIGYQTNQLGDVNLVCGDGMTLTTIDMAGGIVSIQDATTTINQYGGELTILDAAHTTLNISGSATCYYRSSGTLTTANVRSGAVLDFTRDLRARTVTNCTMFSGASVIDAFKTVTWTNGIVLSGCDLPGQQASASQVRRLDLGVNRTVTLAA